MLRACCRQSELKEAFDGMDGDGSGQLAPDEIKEQYRQLGIEISDEQLNATISKADKDGDGKINFEEFLKVWSGGQSK